MEELTTTYRMIDNVRTIDTLKDVPIVGLYFSAGFCKPCREFSPILKEKYSTLQDMLEIVLIPHDKTQELQDEYFKDHPWLTIDCNGVQQLRNQFSVKTIPTLVFIDSATDRVLEFEGRALVRDQDSEQILAHLKTQLGNPKRLIATDF
jgi:nucleoredoxin